MPSIVDLSAPIVESAPETPEPLRTELRFHGHEEGAATIDAMLGVPPHLLRDGEGWAVEEFLRLGTHNTTHVDAPWHYNSTIAGERAQTIDELPLEWFFAPGVCLDFTTKEDGDAVTGRGDRRRARESRPRHPAARHRPDPHRPRHVPRRSRLHAEGPRRHR